MESAGLTSTEARRRLSQYGENEIISQDGVKPFEIFLSQFKSLLILILLIAALIAYFAGEGLDAVFILVIVLLNGIFGFVQEYRAEKAITALKKLVVEKIRVIRDGEEREIDSKDLVPGDVFIVEEGQKVPADAQIVEGFSLSVNEASLTGESTPVFKETSIKPETDDKYFLFAGTTVEQGLGKAVVVKTGMGTRFGKVASLLKEIKEEPTPLQEHLGVLAKQLAIFAIFAMVAIVVLGVIYKKELVEMLLTGASLGVAVVPEGLPAVVTITLAIGVQRMVRVSSIVRKLSSIEAIGSVDVILSDKTGTITKNEMVVKRIWVNNKIVSLKDYKLEDESTKKIIDVGVYCSTTSLSKDERGKTTILGDRTEGSLLLFAEEKGIDISAHRRQGKIIDEFPFNSKDKMMSVIWEDFLGNWQILTKGAAEIILDISSKIQLQNRIVALNSNLKTKIAEAIAGEALKGYRLIAFGLKSIDSKAEKFSRPEAEKNLTFLGFVSIYDPPREGVKEAIQLAGKAGINVVMITGDNPLTAVAIGEEIGLAEKDSLVLTGKELEKFSQEELKKRTEKVKIFARVSPEHKLQIVKAFQDRGFSVGVTGDGVNDSPALKQADVGMAMGVIGTDVAKEVSDMVIADDNFASIVAAVEEGRMVYENILKSVRYLLSCNSGELLAILGTVAVGLPTPLTPIQILWMNLVTDGLPALALAEDPKSRNVMSKPPRNKAVSILQMAGKLRMFSIGIILAFATVATFVLLGASNNLTETRTAAFTILILGQMVVAFLVRKGEKWYSNKLLIFAVFITLLLQFLIITFAPLQKIFDTRFPF